MSGSPSSTDLTDPKFDFRSSPESGPKSDIGLCPVRAAISGSGSYCQIDIEKTDKSGSVQLARSSRASISSRNKAKSMGLVNKPSAPLSIALRLVSESP